MTEQADQNSEDLAVPTIHLNGTGSESLRDQLGNAASALRVAIDALCDATPNQRDYYVQAPEVWGQAMEQHAQRLAKVRSVREEIIAIWDAIEDQMELRREMKR